MRVKRTFRSKFIAVTAIGILVGLIANTWVSSDGLNTLGRESTNEIEEGLGSVSQEYLTNYIKDATMRIDSMFRQAMSDTKFLADITQALMDNAEVMQPINDQLLAAGPFASEMVYDERGPFRQNVPDRPTVLNVFGSSLDADGKIPARTQDYIRETGFLDFVMPAVRQGGSPKIQVYFVSPDEASVNRISPYVDLGSYVSTAFPTYKKTPFYKHFFAGLAETWKTWPQANPEFLEEFSKPEVRSEMRQVTVTPAYDDAAGGGVTMTVFHPVWTKDREVFNGAIGVDLNITEIIKEIQTVAVGQTGFAFLAQSDGNILAMKEKGVKTLGLASGESGAGVKLISQYFKDSKEPAISSLQMPTDDEVHFDEILVGDKAYVLVIKRLGVFSAWSQPGSPDAKPPHIRPDSWTLGFLVPTDEIYSSLIASREAIARSTESIRFNQVAIMVVTLFLVLLGVYWISQRMTTDLVALSKAATRIMNKDYDVQVNIKTEDEVGHLGFAFNEMASEIQEYTQNLESLVQQRTAQLEKASDEIKALNEQLAEENLRLNAEIDVARRLQSMVLPQPDELKAIEGLDIDGYMKPADEVGGDYYDVLQGPLGVTFGIGDVTGHGLESGVLMLMVQTAIRTLQTSGERDPTRFLDLVNRTVYLNKQRMDVDRNLSLCLLDYNDGNLTMTGQHEDVIVIRADGKVELLDTTPLGFPVGLDLDISDLFASDQIQLDDGDVIVLYTDGITEAEDGSGSYYGIERLCEVAAKSHAKAAREIREDIVEDVTQFIDGHEVYDDITLLVIKKT